MICISHDEVRKIYLDHFPSPCVFGVYIPHAARTRVAHGDNF